MKQKFLLLILIPVLIVSILLMYFSAEVSYGVLEKFTLKDFDFTTIEGKHTKLSDIKADFVFIECWATWCPGCMKEHDSLNALSIRFSNASILSICLDKDSFRHEKSIRRNLFDEYYRINDTLGWESKYPDIFKFEDLPFNVLVNSEGVIVGRNLDVSSLQQKLVSH